MIIFSRGENRIFFQDKNSKFQVSGFAFPGTRNQPPLRLRLAKPGTWNLEPGTWNLEPGIYPILKFS